MKEIKQYELTQRDYVPIICESKTSYGGRQQWFSDRLPRSKQAKIHQYGCGMIAACDLFLYWAMTMPYKRENSALRTFEKDGNLLKESYMDFVEYIGEKYIYIFPKVGIPHIEMVAAIDSYMLLHQIPYKARLGYLTDSRKLLRKIIEMIKNDLPVILLIGMPFPNILYHTVLKNKAAGVSFYEKVKKGSGSQTEESYKVSHTSVRGHYVTVTGVTINPNAEDKKEKVMLKIASWGQVYYMSFYEYCRYEIGHGVDPQGSIIYISPRG